MKPLVVVMGVSGSGKSTIGELLAEKLGVSFVDSDSLHPIGNIEKMAAGVPLNDQDRWGWLARVGETLHEAEDTGLVVACSALKHEYREAIRSREPAVSFVQLHGSKQLLADRLDKREGHFMPQELLDSQLATLEPVREDERAIVVDVDVSVAEVVRAAVAGLRALGLRAVG